MRVTQTHLIAVDDVGQRFQKRYVDGCLGRYETTVSPEAVRDEVVSRLTHQSPPGGSVSLNGVDGDQDRFCGLR